MTRHDDDQFWALAHAERAALAEDLAALSDDEWRHATLCGEWDVEAVVAHLVAAASTGPWSWARSIVGARFRAVVDSTTAPSGHTPAYLGEVVVHAQDIRRPLGLARIPSIDALTPVAEFFARRDFAVASRTHAAGLELRADDGPFTAGSGPLVTPDSCHWF